MGSGTRIGLAAGLAAAIGCSSGGGGGGGAPSCADGGSCPSGFVCNASGICVSAGSGGASADSSSGGATGGVGAVSGSGGVGAAGAGGVGGSGGAGGVGGSGASGGSGGAIVCPSGQVGSTCQQVYTGTGTCNACTQQYCCALVDSCLADPTCADLLECYLSYCGSKGLQCASTTCSSCANNHPLFKPISDCWYANCQAGCSFLQP